MREIGKYNSGEIESKWYTHWLNNKYFHAKVSDKEPYTIVIPPPNAAAKGITGHMLNNTVQDVLIRRARMLGMNACCWYGLCFYCNRSKSGQTTTRAGY